MVVKIKIISIFIILRLKLLEILQRGIYICINKHCKDMATESKRKYR
ncbi:hypothetical protein HMPREF0653_00218 [Prevotella disiens JCM 6334 = ATCC 29426]|uniref:Uncharacterized protein n=1 Tax=Prevotella disiens JCM 6334 = ATCC 29426 TaxID=1235811 RepID=A0ABN0NV87_9BACT|nr:hypothetical protein HMPREF0653_00218 [Prevotella disiens JCM 6334 = ATCC 29426]